MKNDISYKCDPARAVTCRKRMCQINTPPGFPACSRTSRVEWAALDEHGEPILAKEIGKEIPHYDP